GENSDVRILGRLPRATNGLKPVARQPRPMRDARARSEQRRNSSPISSSAATSPRVAAKGSAAGVGVQPVVALAEPRPDRADGRYVASSQSPRAIGAGALCPSARPQLSHFLLVRALHGVCKARRASLREEAFLIQPIEVRSLPIERPLADRALRRDLVR